MTNPSMGRKYKTPPKPGHSNLRREQQVLGPVEVGVSLTGMGPGFAVFRDS